jgi:dipeptidyl aminopeptidase/acylaminoacyl peptidase
VALAIAAVGILGAAIVFLGGTPRPAAPVSNGRIAFSGFDGTAWQIYSVEPDGSGLTQLTTMSDLEVATEPAWSPDGRQIAFVVVADRGSGRSDIWLMEADGGNAHPITDGSGSSWAPTWSPEGTRIAFMHSLDGAEQVWIMNADGSDRQAFTRCGGPECLRDDSPVWSPDGESIAFVRESGAGAVIPVSINVWPTDGSGDLRSIPITGALWAMELAWSPDGLRLAFTRSLDEGKGFGLAVVDADGSDLRRLTEVPTAQGAAWSPDGRQIVFMANVQETGRESLFVMNADGTEVREIPGLPLEATSPSWQLLRPESTVEPSPSEPMTVEVRVTTIRVPEFSSAVAFGEGGVWVTSCCTDGTGPGEVTRLDPATGDIVASIPVRAVPGWDFGGAGLTVANGSVWTLGATQRAEGGCCDGVVSKIDPATNSTVDELVLPGITDGDLWVDEDAVYVLGFAAEGPGLDLARLSTTTHEVAWRVEVPGQWSQTVFVAGGSVWVLGTAPDAHGPVEVTTWYRFDQETGELLAELGLQQSQYIPAVHQDTVWYRTEDGAQLFDTTSGELVGGPVQPGPGCCIGPFVSDGAGGVWVVSSPGAGIERSIWHIDPSGSVVASGTIEDKDTFDQMAGQSYGFDLDTQTIWVQHYGDSVTRIEIARAVE